MATPLKYAAAHAAVQSPGEAVVPTGAEEELYLRDVKWARTTSTPGSTAAPRTPSKLRQAIDAASVAAVSESKAPASSSDKGSVAAVRVADPLVKLRTDVIDAVSQFDALLEDTKFRSARNRQSCNASATSIIERLRAFDSGYRYTARVGFGVPRLVNEVKIDVNLQLQQRYGTSIVVPDKERYLAVLDILRGGPVAARDRDSLRERIVTNVTRPLLPLGDADIPRLLLNVNTFTTTDVLQSARAQLDTLTAKARRLQEELDELQSQFDSARKGEDLAAADKLEDQILDVMQAMFDTHLERMALVGSSANDQSRSNSGMADELERIMRTDAIDAIDDQNRDLVAKSAADGDTLDRDRAARHREHQQALAGYASAAQRSLERLERNQYQQDTVWAEVVKGIARIDELRQEAANMTDAHLQMTETEQRRRKEYAEYQESYAEHREYVRLVNENSAAARNFISEVRNHLDTAREALRDMHVEERLHALATSERGHLERFYAKYSGRLARRAHTLDARATNAARQQSEANFQLKQIAACDDPDGRAHAARQETLAKTTALLQRRAQDAQERFDRCQDGYVDAMAAFDDFDETQNAAVLAAQLRAKLREQFAGQLDSLTEAQGACDSELRARVADHEQKALAVKMITERKKKASKSLRNLTSFRNRPGSAGSSSQPSPAAQTPSRPGSAADH